MMKRLNIFLAGLLIAGFLTACTARELAPARSESSTATAVQAAQKEAWEIEWQKTLSEAKKEGRVVIYGVPGIDVREAMVKEFQKAYPGIMVEYTGVSGAEVSTKIMNERRAGIYLLDLHIGGTGAILPTGLKGASQPLEPLLILPEVKDLRNWMGGKFDFADKEGKVNLVMSSFLAGFVVYNTKLLSPESAKTLSLWDLTKPEWEGKVMIFDPRVPGPGQSMGNLFYYNTKLGPDFIKALARNKPIISRDGRQMAEWVSQAKQPVALSIPTPNVLEFIKAGAPLKQLYSVKEGGYLAAGFGSVIAMDKAPHQNATRVYLNWLLSREGQTVFSRVMDYVSRRTDVPTDHVNPESVPVPGVEYIETYSEKAIELRIAIASFIREAFGY